MSLAIFSFMPSTVINSLISADLIFFMLINLVKRRFFRISPIPLIESNSDCEIFFLFLFLCARIANLCDSSRISWRIKKALYYLYNSIIPSSLIMVSVARNLLEPFTIEITLMSWWSDLLIIVLTKLSWFLPPSIKITLGLSSESA